MSKLQKVQDDDYEIIDKGEENFHHIVLKDSSPFPFVVFQFGKVQLIEDVVNDCLNVKFEYEVFENPKNLDTQAEMFREYVGNILMTNLEELLIYNQYKKSNQE
jgi:hypothetical protein